MRCAFPICLRERWRHQPTGWPRSMPMARSRPSAVFADPGDDRLSGPEKTSVFRATRLDSLVRRRGTGIRPPSVQGNVTGHYRASPVSSGRRAVRGEPCPLPCPGFRAEGTHSHRGVHSAVLFDRFPAAVPSDGAPAAGASRKGERSQAEETRAPPLRCRVFRSLVENGLFGVWVFSCFCPMQTVRSVRRQSIPPPLRATMLRLLRRPFPAPCASRIPEIPPGSGAMLISPILFIVADRALVVGTRTGPTACPNPSQVPSPLLTA